MTSNPRFTLMKALLLNVCLLHQVLVNGVDLQTRSVQNAKRDYLEDETERIDGEYRYRISENAYSGWSDSCTIRNNPLDCFLGEWIELSKEGFDDVAKAAGLSKEAIQYFETHKSILGYIRQGDQWIYDIGIVGVAKRTKVPFKLGVPYMSFNIDGSPLECITHSEGNVLSERCEHSVGTKFVMYLVKHVMNKTMFSHVFVGTAKMLVIYHYNGPL